MENFDKNKYKIIVDSEREIYLMSDENDGVKKQVKRRYKNTIAFTTYSIYLIENNQKVFNFKDIVPSWCKFIWSSDPFCYDLGLVNLQDCVHKEIVRKKSRFYPFILLHEISHALEDDCNGKPCNKEAPSKEEIKELLEFEVRAWSKAFLLLKNKAKTIQEIMCYKDSELVEYATKCVSTRATKEQKKTVQQKYFKIILDKFKKIDKNFDINLK